MNRLATDPPLVLCLWLTPIIIPLFIADSYHLVAMVQTVGVSSWFFSNLFEGRFSRRRNGSR